MRNETPTSEADQRYSAAYEVHYGTKDLEKALELYRGVLVACPGTQEAGYSRSQIHNIIRKVVPERVLFDAQVGLALAHFRDRAPAVLERTA